MRFIEPRGTKNRIFIKNTLYTTNKKTGDEGLLASRTSYEY